jgi:chromosome segregation ATPase
MRTETLTLDGWDWHHVVLFRVAYTTGLRTKMMVITPTAGHTIPTLSRNVLQPRGATAIEGTTLEGGTNGKVDADTNGVSHADPSPEVEAELNNLRSENSRLSLARSTLEEQCTQFQTELVAAKADTADMSTRLDEATAHNKLHRIRVQEQLSEAESTMAGISNSRDAGDTSEEINELKEQLAAQVATAAAAAEEVATLKQALETANETASQGADASATVSAELEEVRKELADANAKIEKLQSDCDVRVEGINALEVQLSEAKSTIARFEMEHETQVEELSSQATRRQSVLEDQLHALTSESSTDPTSGTVVSEAMAQLDSIKAELEAAVKASEEGAAAKAAAEQKLDEVESAEAKAREELAEAAADADALRADCDARREGIEALEQQLSESKSTISRVENEHETEVAELSQAVTEHTERAAALGDELTTARSEHDSKLDEMNDAMAHKEKRVIELEAFFEQLSAESAALKSKLEESQAVSGDNESEAIAQLTAQLDQLRNELKETSEHRSTLTTEAHEAAAKLEGAEGAATEAREALAVAMANADKLQADRDNYAESVKSLETEHAETKAALEKVEAGHAEVSGKADEHATRVSQLEAQIAEAEEAHGAQLAEENASLEAQVAEGKAALEHAEATHAEKMSALNVEADENAKRVSDLEAQLKAAQDEHSSTTAESGSLESELTETKAALAKAEEARDADAAELTAKVADHTKLVDELTAQLKAAQDDHGTAVEELSKTAAASDEKHVALAQQLEQMKDEGSGEQAKLKEDHAEATQKASDLQVQLDEKSTAHDTQAKELDELKQAVEASSTQAKESADQINKLMDGSIALTQRKTELEAEVEELKAEVEMAKNAAGDTSKVEEKVTELETRLKQAEEEAQDGADRTSKMMDGTIALTARKAELEADVERLTAELVEAKAAGESSAEHLAEMESLKEGHTQALTSLEADLATAEARATTLAQEVETAQAELTEARAAADGGAGASEDLDKLKKEMEAQTDENNTQIDKLTMKVITMSDLITTLEEEKQGAAKEIETLSETVSTQMAEMTSLKERINSVDGAKSGSSVQLAEGFSAAAFSAAAGGGDGLDDAALESNVTALQQRLAQLEQTVGNGTVPDSAVANGKMDEVLDGTLAKGISELLDRLAAVEAKADIKSATFPTSNGDGEAAPTAGDAEDDEEEEEEVEEDDDDDSEAELF